MQDATKARYYLTPTFHAAPGDVAPVIDPATEEHVGDRAVLSADALVPILTQLRAAQEKWAALDAKTRAGFLHKVANRIEATDMQDCAILMSREMGKPYPEAIGELANCAPIFRYYAEMARDEAGKVAGTTQAGSLQFAQYAPYGVSAHIIPFNFPILITCWTVAASLAAGNACAIKPAEATTLSTLVFMSVFDDLPENLVACLPGDAATGAALVESDLTDAVAFTGSVAAARKVGATAGALMKPAVIEAGGSDPMIISAHAPLDVAAAGAVTAAFHLSGQICTSTERIYAVDAIHDAFVEAFATQTRALRIGNGLERSEIGPLVSKAARDKVERLVDDAVAKGAKIVCGGRIPPEQKTGWFYEPTILTDCTAEMDLLREEIFGPVVAIVRVPDFETALKQANDSPFGLGASVFTTDLAEAHDAANLLQAGMVWVNNPLIDNDALPFGGWKSSGLGRELGRQGLDAFRQSKMVIMDHKPIRHEWWYPYPDEWFLDTGGRKHV